jgi:hypothetical protein
MHDQTEPATLAGVMDDLSRRGFTEHFMLRNGRLRTESTAATFAAEQLAISEYYRFEGVSDPDDMAILYAIETRDGIRGTLTDAFGVYADPLVGAFIRAVPFAERARIRHQGSGVSSHREWRRSMSIQSINPATGDTLETFEETPAAEIERMLTAAHAAFSEWRQVPFGRRAQHMRKAAEILRARKADYARTMTLEMGKPIAQGEAEIDKCAWVCDHYAEHAEAYLAEQARETDASRSYVRFDPLGVVLAVMPWNFPFWPATPGS